MNLSKPVFYAIIFCFFVVICLCVKLYTDGSKHRSDYMKDALIREGQIKQLKVQLDIEKEYTKKSISQRDSVLELIKEKEKSKQVLKKNYEKKNDHIVHLNADGSISFLSSKLSE